MTPFVQYKQWMIKRYGAALFRVPVQLATSCPHGRCAFCSENGAKAQQTQKHESPQEQIEAAIKFSKRRYKAQKLMLYIQAFTADLTDPAQQQEIFQALEKYNFTAISIGTRPDCLPKEALDFLQQLQIVGQASLESESLCSSGSPQNTRSRIREARPANSSFEVWIELGVQTANDETLKQINRGHNWACSKKAILDLAARGIHVAPHVIIGLPGESSEHWKNTADELAKLPISGIKIHNLHIMKGTGFAKTLPPTMNHWEYAEALMDFLRRIPADTPVMRISTDTPDDELIAPHWPLEKGQFLDYVIQQMEMREIRQGDLFQPLEKAVGEIPKPVKTDDGSVTFFSNDWKEHYHTKSGARLEAQQKFIEPSKLVEKLKTQDVKLLDVCFGLGNNSLAALCAAGENRLEITALEMDKRVVRAASQFFQPLENDPVDWKQVLSELL
ncbi:MAG: radical SAM protein, partial [Kiritimatiellales bacterium]